jgi:hypothetical protein
VIDGRRACLDTVARNWNRNGRRRKMSGLYRSKEGITPTTLASGKERNKVFTTVLVGNGTTGTTEERSTCRTESMVQHTRVSG